MYKDVSSYHRNLAQNNNKNCSEGEFSFCKNAQYSSKINPLRFILVFYVTKTNSLLHFRRNSITPTFSQTRGNNFRDQVSFQREQEDFWQLMVWLKRKKKTAEVKDQNEDHFNNHDESENKKFRWLK